MPGKARKKTVAKNTVEPELGSHEWKIFMKDRLIASKDEHIAILMRFVDDLKACTDRDDLRIAQLSSQLDEAKNQITQLEAALEAATQPAKKKASSRPHSFKIFAGGKTEQASPRADHS